MRSASFANRASASDRPRKPARTRQSATCRHTETYVSGTHKPPVAVTDATWPDRSPGRQAAGPAPVENRTARAAHIEPCSLIWLGRMSKCPGTSRGRPMRTIGMSRRRHLSDRDFEVGARHGHRRSLRRRRVRPDTDGSVSCGFVPCRTRRPAKSTTRPPRGSAVSPDRARHLTWKHPLAKLWSNRNFLTESRQAAGTTVILSAPKNLAEFRCREILRCAQNDESVSTGSSPFAHAKGANPRVPSRSERRQGASATEMNLACESNERLVKTRFEGRSGFLFRRPGRRLG